VQRPSLNPILVIAPAILLAVCLWPHSPYPSLTVDAIRALGLLAFTIILWASEALDAAVTSLMVFLLLPLLGILPMEEAASTLGTETVWQLILIYMMAEAIGQFHLHQRFSYRLLLLSAGNTKLLFAAFVVITTLFTFFMPVPVGKVALIIPLIKEALEALGIGTDSNLNRIIYFAIGSIGLFSGVGILTGCPTNLYSVLLMGQELSASWSYSLWLTAFFPIVIISSAMIWLVLLKTIPPEKPPQTGTAFKLFIKQKLADLGPLSISEKKLGLIVAIMIVLWATSGTLHSLSVTQACLLAVITLFLPGVKLLSFKQATSGISWSAMLVFAAGLALTRGLTATGAAAWLGGLVSSLFTNLSPTAAGIAVFIFLVTMRAAFTTPTAYAAALLPVVFAAGPNLGLNPIWLGALTTIAAHTAFLYPMQSMTLMTAYSASSLNAKEVFKAGLLTTAVTIPISLLFAYYYWPLIGLTPFR
jgi:sodium-dependent dicarboxylate transporter 2/3/5